MPTAVTAATASTPAATRAGRGRRAAVRGSDGLERSDMGESAAGVSAAVRVNRRECALFESGGLPPLNWRRSRGGIPERSKGTGCKPVGSAFAGSNPAPTTAKLRIVDKAAAAVRRPWKERRRWRPRVIKLAGPAPAGRPALRAKRLRGEWLRLVG